MRSIRRRLVTVLLAGTGLTVVASALVGYGMVRRQLVAGFDETSLSRVSTLAGVLESDGEEVEFELFPQLAPAFFGGEDPEYFQMWREDGAALFRSFTLGQGDLPCRTDRAHSRVVFDLRLPDGRAGRAIGILLQSTGDPAAQAEAQDAAPTSGAAAPLDTVLPGAPVPPRIHVVVARSREGLDAALGSILAGHLAVGLVGAAALLALVLAAVRVGLRPLVALGREVQAIDAGRLSRRLDPGAVPAELTDLSRKINELLARLESSFERERRMTANLAHELRTPLAELRSAVDVARRWPDDPALTAEALDTAHAVSLQMGRMVAALLKLARIEAHQGAPATETVRLRDLVQELWPAHASTAADKQLTLDDQVAPETVAVADRELLTLVVGNLLDNAVEHSPARSTICCTAREDGAGVTWTITNPSPGLDAADLPHLTEAFWQKDASRSTRGHSGLGLTLAHWVVGALGVPLSFQVLGERLTAELRLRRA